MLFCSAPGLDERKTDEASWRAGFEWWQGCGLAIRATTPNDCTCGSRWRRRPATTIDEDFPGIAALVSPTGAIIDRLADWRPGTLVVDIPDHTSSEPSD